MPSEQGQFLQADYYVNTGGLSLSDSPFVTDNGEATGGYNYQYAFTGGVRKRDGHSLINSSADTSLLTLGMGTALSSTGTRTYLRAAARKLQNFSLTVPSFTNLSYDTTGAGTDIFASNTTQPVVFSQFNTTSINVLWMAGGGLTNLVGAYSSTKVTNNGVPVPTGTFTLTAGSSGGTLATGTYFYAVSWRKVSTGAYGNAVLDKSVSVTAGQTVTVDFTGVVNPDATTYDTIVFYRSAVSGVTGFTTGDILSAAYGNGTFIDTGDPYTAATVVPRAGNSLLDNSKLPSGTYNTVTTWKRRLVTASGSNIYVSDLNKPESWPLANYLTIPSGGPITGLAIISFTTPTSTSIDELLCVFKENELWVVTGSIAPTAETDTILTDWSIKFISNNGCPGQPLVVAANGFLAWVNYRGIYMWEGSGKPIFCSKPIDPLFALNGDLDKTQLGIGWGAFFEKTQEICWFLSHTILGTQKYSIKMDLKLTVPNIKSGLDGRVVEAVFIQDYTTFPIYAGATTLVSSEETFLAGDNAGYCYKLYNGLNDNASGVAFSYETKFFDMGTIGISKRFQTVVVWVEDTTDASLTLDFWTTYRSGIATNGTMSAVISTQVSEAFWDLAYWDASAWDNTLRSYRPVVFHLNAADNSTEGDCIKLKLSQTSTNAPVNIAGFSIIYTMGGIRK